MPVTVSKHLSVIRIQHGPRDYGRITGGLVCYQEPFGGRDGLSAYAAAVKGQTLYSVGAWLGQGGSFFQKVLLPPFSCPGMDPC